MTFEKDRRARRAMASNDLEIGMSCIKYLLCAVNFLFVLTGIAIIAIGWSIFTMYEDFSYFLDARYFSPALLLVGIGAAIFVVAFFGCCGALKESTCMVLVKINQLPNETYKFAVSLFMILFLEFSAALASYAYRDIVIAVINTKIDQTMHMYENNLEAKRAIDFLQTQMFCCGFNGPKDWAGILTNSSNPYNVPDSCCYQGQIGCSKIHENGCYNDLAFLVKNSALYVIIGATMIILAQFSGIIFACLLGRSIRYQKTVREMRRWQQYSPSPVEHEPF